jgi:lysophospholipase L1-like esterase
VYFIDGASPLFEVGKDYFVDGIHPSDLGYYLMAKAVAEALRGVLK